LHAREALPRAAALRGLLHLDDLGDWLVAIDLLPSVLVKLQ
jgi:hypothetical protein